MFEQVLESRAWLASWVAGMALLNYSVGVLVLHEYSTQQFVERDDWRPPGIGGRLMAIDAPQPGSHDRTTPTAAHIPTVSLSSAADRARPPGSGGRRRELPDRSLPPLLSPQALLIGKAP